MRGDRTEAKEPPRLPFPLRSRWRTEPSGGWFSPAANMKEDMSYYLYVYYAHSKSADCDPLRPPPQWTHISLGLWLFRVICPDAGVGTVDEAWWPVRSK